MGTQTRPVPGCTQKGDLSKWLRCLETSESRRGYVYSRMISCLASLRSLVSSFYEGTGPRIVRSHVLKKWSGEGKGEVYIRTCFCNCINILPLTETGAVGLRFPFSAQTI